MLTDPVAPATGTPETGGWSTRELRTILRGLESLNLIAADIVEVAVSSPPMTVTWRARARISGCFVLTSWAFLVARLRHQCRADDHGRRRRAVRDHEHHGQEGAAESDGL